MNRAKGLTLGCAFVLVFGSACGQTRSATPAGSAAGAAAVGASGGRAAGGGGGALGAADLGGTAGLGTAGVPIGPAKGCPGNPVKCLDPFTAQFCDDQDQRLTAECKVGMVEEGFVSTGCESNAQGDGCTVDAFMDDDCEAGAPLFTACLGGTAEDLLDVYAACSTDLKSARVVISCYRDFLAFNDDTLVDCDAAQAACWRP